VLDLGLQAHRRALDRARRDAERAVDTLSRASAVRAHTLASLRARRDLTRREVVRLDRLARAADRRSAVLSARVSAPIETKSATTAAPSPAPTVPLQPGGTRTLVVDAVAYHLPGTTASGIPVGMGIVAVDPNVIPLGTKMFVPGYGKAVAADVGSAVRGTIIDLWMPSRAKALAWGRRTVTITLYG
jgi:3D (Asp-Asp-Asp) domain-containing protein